MTSKRSKLCLCVLPFFVHRWLGSRLKADAYAFVGNPTGPRERFYAHTVYMRCSRCKRVVCRDRIWQVWPRVVSAEEAARAKLTAFMRIEVP